MRKYFSLAAACLAAATAIALQASGTSASATTTTSHTLIGAAMGQHSNETFAQAVDRGDTIFGKLHCVRVYHSGLPKTWPQLLAETNNSPMVVSFKELPSSVLTGKHDSFYRNWFATAPRTMVNYWSYFHEPENDIEAHHFTATQYRAAFAHLAALAHRASNPNLKSSLILMGFTASPYSHRNWLDYYPGSTNVDAIGWDIYNHHGQAVPTNYEDPSTLFAGAMTISARAGKPWGLGEFNSLLARGDSTGTGRAAWLLKVGSFAKLHNAAYALLFDSNNGSNWELHDSPSIHAWRTVNTTS